MTSYERYCYVRDQRKVKDAHVAEAAGIGKSTFSDWKSGRSIPKRAKMEKIANVLGVSVEYLLSGEEPEGYYTNPKTAQIAERIYQDQYMGMVFDALDNSSPEEIKDFYDMLMLMKRRERHED